MTNSNVVDNVQIDGQMADLNGNHSVADQLNDLISMNRGIIGVYQTAAERLENESYVELLAGTAEEHKTFVIELSNLVASNGGVPTSDADRGSMLKQAWVVLRAALTDGDGPIMKAVAQNAEYLLEAYAEKMAANLPDDVRELIGRQLSQTRLIHEKFSTLSAVLNS